MRIYKTYPVTNTEIFKQKLLIWANQFSRIAYLDSNNYSQSVKSNFSYNSYECLVGVDSLSEIISNDNEGFKSLKEYINKTQDWLFGFFSYDLKNEDKNLSSNNFDGIIMPELHFFQPKYIFIVFENCVQIAFLPDITNADEINNIFKEINNVYPPSSQDNAGEPGIKIAQRYSRQEYLETVNKLKYHIQRGDIFEINFCQEFYSENAVINPLHTYFKLKNVSPTPFSSYYRLDAQFLLCASPERFIKKIGNKLISQPIKGTIRRGTTEKEDISLKAQLKNDPKERAENIMIVDLVRNDLSRTAQKKTVKVEELCEIYSFKQVHQMISTVVSKLHKKNHFIDAVKNAFPMGSMTGAPKIRAMELIEKYEKTKRGLYSGSVGYISPDGNFDFNVVIRSILYNKTKKYLSFIAGSAITSKSIPEKEYDECLVKAEAMLEVLN